jgi:hypothetical protein
MNRPDLLFADDQDLAARVARHPALLWKAKNARRHTLLQLLGNAGGTAESRSEALAKSLLRPTRPDA